MREYERGDIKKMTGKLQLALSTAAMLLFIVAALLTSFQIAIYGDSEYGFYKDLYEKYQVTGELDMELEDVMTVTDYMMAYLIGEEEELSIVTDVDGRKQDFFNEQDRLHMADVRRLFLGGLKLRTVFLILAAVIIVVLFFQKVDMRKILTKTYSWALAAFLAALVFLGIGFAVDFTACFRIFHEIFFTNDLWMFDPAEDYMIRMLPEGFFFDMAVRIVLIFLGFLLMIRVLLWIWKAVPGKLEAYGEITEKKSNETR